MEKDQTDTGNLRDFWDISELIPPRRSGAPRASAPSMSHDTSAVDIMVPSRGQEASLTKQQPLSEPQERTKHSAVNVMSNREGVMVGDVPLPPRAVSLAPDESENKKSPPELVYSPAGSLLREVRIYPHRKDYTYYGAFVNHARKLHPIAGKEVPFVPFFSYMPQYTQLTRPQLAYYFWWRTNFRQGRILPADFSYLLLYLYEIINLGDTIDPKVGQKSMQQLWLAYRGEHPRLDALVREWLCDYALIHQLSPLPLPPELLRELVRDCRLKEFYISGAEGDAMCDAVLTFASNYDYTKSKFYRGDAVAQFDRILRGAVQLTLAHLSEKNGENAPRVGGFSTITRDSFTGALCAAPQRRRIEVDFLSFSHTYELRYIVSDVLKYAENSLRAVLGVKSRLTVYEVSGELREKLDAYLAQALPKRASRAAAAPVSVPDYEKRYDLPSTAFSPERAAAIEAESWQTTKRLVEAFEGEALRVTERGALVKSMPPYEHIGRTTVTLPPAAPVAKELPAVHAATGLAVALGDLCALVTIVDRGDRTAARAFAHERGAMLDALVDKINTAADDLLGDIILEESNGFYGVIEDYRVQLKEEGVLP